MCVSLSEGSAAHALMTNCTVCVYIVLSAVKIALNDRLSNESPISHANENENNFLFLALN